MLVLGDAHATTAGRRRALFAAYRAADESVAVQAGDLMYYDLPFETYFIGGNNEDFDTIDALRNGRVESESVSNVTLLHSTAETVEGRRVAGLSGNHAPTQFDKPRAVLRGDRRRHFVHDDVEEAKRLEDVDVFVAHEAPNGLPVEEDYQVGCEHIDEILDALDPEVCLVGHHHQHAESEYGDTQVYGLDPVWESYYTLDPDTLEVTRHDAPPA
jgi:Icc-related predicted phosphoesterase